MNAILEGLLKSNKSEKEKNAVIKGIIEAGKKGQTQDTILNMYETTTKIMLRGSSAYQWNAAKSVYVIWAKNHRDCLRDFFTTDTLHKLLDEQYPNKFNAVWVIHTSMLELKQERDFVRMYEHLCDILMKKSIHFVRSYPEYEVLTPYCRFLMEFRLCIPRGEFTATFCKALITNVSAYSVPRSENPLEYIRNVANVIGGLLDHIWKKSDNDVVMQCLQHIFNLIKYVDERGKAEAIAPSSSLAALAQYLPTHTLDQVLGAVVNDPSIDPAQLKQALDNLMLWLQWPGARNLQLWVVGFLRQLTLARKYTIIIDVTETHVDKIFQLVTFPAVRESAFAVLSYMLLSFQHSPLAFHAVAEHVPGLIAQVRKEIRDGDRVTHDAAVNILHRLTDLLHCLMYLHPGFPEIYEPILHVIGDLARPTTVEMERRLSEYRWSSLPALAQQSTTMALERRSDTGKVGLANLGNTCYMNSVVQALLMCDGFRQSVLTAMCGPKEAAKSKLQKLFALLCASQRPFVTPTSFVSVRPAWFEDGHQQDCSEFLKYLLDRLHEEERGASARASPSKDNSLLKKKTKKSKDQSDQHQEQQGSLVEQTFTGKVLNTYTCLRCKSESTRVEKFNDLPLAFSSDGGKHKTGALGGGNSAYVKTFKDSSASSGKKESVEHLVEQYLRPERLEGDNKYACERCRGLQDAERRLQVIQSPTYLILTLLRFSFDPKTQRHAKIFTDVNYPKTLYLPVHYQEASPPTSPTDSVKSSKSGKSSTSSVSSDKSPPPRLHMTKEAYALTCVVVHSGLSSDGGHYYTYARHSKPNATDTVGRSGASDYLEDRWFLFNDHRVSYSSYQSFSSVTQKFSKDTAYVLVYKKISADDLLEHHDREPGLRKDLMKMVDTDNKQYLQELERAEQIARQRRAVSGSHPGAVWPPGGWREDDRDGGPGCGGGGMGGGGGGFSGPRLVF